MANKQTRLVTMLNVYRQLPDIAKSMAMTSFFKTTSRDITNSDEVMLDIKRSDEYIAPVLRDISQGTNIVSEDIYTNKQFKPPAYSQSEPFNVFDLLKVPFGSTEFESVDYQAELMARVGESWKTLTEMILRSIELQASQILLTGKLNLPGKNGALTYELDYVPKNTHFPTVGTDWSDTSSDIFGDVEALSDVVRDDGLVDVKNLLMGKNSFKDFKNNTAVSKELDNRRINTGVVDPRMMANGFKHQATFHIGNYDFDVFTYNARYVPLDGSPKTKFMDDDKVVFLPDLEELDFRKVFAGVPIVVDSDPRYAQLMPPRVAVPGAFSFKPRIWTDEAAETVMSEVKSRPLLMPVSIDRYACLDTKI